MDRERELDEIKMAYLEAHEAGQAPALEELVARHAQYREELVDFVVTFLELERALPAEPEPAEAAASTGRLREDAVRAASAAGTLGEALVAAGVGREEAAAVTDVPVSFIVRVERGRLVPDGEEPVDPKFLARLGEVLQRTAEEVLEILRATFATPSPRPRALHTRGRGRSAATNRPTPQPFRALLAGCPDLTPEQRRRWLGDA